MKDFKKLAGKNIRHLRLQKNMTQQQVADHLDVERQYVSSLENGQVNMSLEYLEKLSDIFDCQPDDFLKELENYYPDHLNDEHLYEEH